jgi:hypothetical protein
MSSKGAYMQRAILVVSLVCMMCAGCIESEAEDGEAITVQGVVCRLYCDSNIWRSIAAGTSSFSCAAATAGLNQFLENYATNDCAALSYDVQCGLNINITNQCFPVENSGSIQINGLATYRCGRIDC